MLLIAKFVLKCEEFIVSYSINDIKEVRCNLLAIICREITKNIEPHSYRQPVV